MTRVQSEYKVEALLTEHLHEMQYEYVQMPNDDVPANFHETVCRLNSQALINAEGK